MGALVGLYEIVEFTKKKQDSINLHDNKLYSQRYLQGDGHTHRLTHISQYSGMSSYSFGRLYKSWGVVSQKNCSLTWTWNSCSHSIDPKQFFFHSTDWRFCSFLVWIRSTWCHFNDFPLNGKSSIVTFQWQARWSTSMHQNSIQTTIVMQTQSKQLIYDEEGRP